MSVLLCTLQELGERKMERKAGNHEMGKELHQKAGKKTKLDVLVWREALKGIPLLEHHSASQGIYPSPERAELYPKDTDLTQGKGSCSPVPLPPGTCSGTEDCEVSSL